MSKQGLVGVFFFGVLLSVVLIYLANFNPYLTATKGRIVATNFFIIFYEYVVWYYIRTYVGMYDKESKWYEKDIYIFSGIVLFFILPIMFLSTIVLMILGHDI